MPHPGLVSISTQHAAAMGDAYAHLHKARTAGASGPVMIALGSLEGALARLSEYNASIGEIAHGLSDEVKAEAEGEKPAPASTDTIAPVEPQPKVEANIVKDPAKRR